MEEQSVQQCNICRFCGSYHDYLRPIMVTEDEQTFPPNTKIDEQNKLINIVEILLGINVSNFIVLQIIIYNLIYLIVFFFSFL